MYLWFSEEQRHFDIHDAIRAYRLGFLPAWNTFISDPPLSALAKAEYCDGLVRALNSILDTLLLLRTGDRSDDRGFLEDLAANAQMMLARVMAVEKTDECINCLGERRLINDNSAMEFARSLWKGPDRDQAWGYLASKPGFEHWGPSRVYKG